VLKRDFLQAEIERLAKVLARLMGLKDQNKLDEADLLIEKVLSEEYGLSLDFLTEASVQDFYKFLRDKSFPAQKIDLLVQFLYQASLNANQENANPDLLKKTLLVMDLLEKEYHQQSLSNLKRRTLIENYLKEHESDE
jgi:hypothetical protein